MGNKTSFASLFGQLLLLLKGVKKHSFISLVIIIFQGITEGVGLLFIIPLLALAGVGNIEQSDNGIIKFIKTAFETAEIPISIQIVLIIYVSIMCFYALLKYLQSVNTSIINQRVVQYWRNLFFERLTFASWTSVTSIKNSDLQHVLSIEIRKFSSISNQLISMTGSIILITIYLFISLFLSLKLTALAVIPMGLLLLINRPINRKTHALGKASVGSNRDMQSIILEHLQAIKLVKSFQKEAEHIQEFKNINRDLEKQTVSYIKANSKTRLIFEVLVALLIAVYIYLAVIVFETGLSELLLLILIFVRLLPITTKLASNYQQFLNFLPAIDLSFGLIRQLENEVNNRQNGTQAEISFTKSIQFDKVSFDYGERKVLDALSFSLKANETSLILGPSGSGKSTTIDLILGLIQRQKGQILIDSTPLTESNMKLWQKTIGFVPQEPFLFHSSIGDNLRWANPKATKEEIVEVLKQAGAENLINKLPNGLNTIVGDRGAQLSGGERQRIALARALIRQPQLLILDEATNAVDDETEELIKEALAELHGKMTIIIVAHRSKLITLADQVIQLK